MYQVHSWELIRGQRVSLLASAAANTTIATIDNLDRRALRTEVSSRYLFPHSWHNSSRLKVAVELQTLAIVMKFPCARSQDRLPNKHGPAVSSPAGPRDPFRSLERMHHPLSPGRMPKNPGLQVPRRSCAGEGAGPIASSVESEKPSCSLLW